MKHAALSLWLSLGPVFVCGAEVAVAPSMLPPPSLGAPSVSAQEQPAPSAPAPEAPEVVEAQAPAQEPPKAAAQPPSQSADEIRDAEWNFFREAAQDPTTELRDAAFDGLNLFVLKYPDGPDAPDALALSAQLLTKRGDYKAAAVAWLRLFWEYPKSQAAQSRAIFTDLVERKFSRKQKPALLKLSQAADSDDRADRLALLVWNISDSAADAFYEPALALANQTQARFPDYKDADRLQWSIAQIHDRNGYAPQALLAYRQLLAVYAASAFRAKAQFAVGALYADKFKDYRRAIHSFEEMVAQHPDAPQAAEALERAALLHADRLKQYDSAAQSYEKLIKMFPKTEAALRAYNAEAKLQRDKMSLPDEAIKTYRRLAAEFGAPAGVEALQDAAEIARKDLKNYSLESELRKALADGYPNAKVAPEELYAAAQIQEDDLKDADKAMEIYKEVQEKFPGAKQAKKAAERVAKIEKAKAQP